jgi:hypothetical protein
LNKRLHDLKAKRDSLAEEERNTELAAIDAQTQREKQNIVTLQNSIAQASQVYNLFFFLNLNTMKPQ